MFAPPNITSQGARKKMDVSIDQVWSLKEPCRANNWRGEEVVALLATIKAHNLMKGCPSSNQLGQLVEPLLGHGRTAFQISGKLKNLRKSYLTCEKKGRTPAALKECPYYDLLAEVYGDEGDDSSEDANNASGGGCAAEDVKVTSERGIEKMLAVIKDLNLLPDLPLRNYSPGAVRLISKMLVEQGVCASSEQVRSTLNELRRRYVEFRRSRMRNGSCRKDPPYLEYLDFLWGSIDLADPPGDPRATPARTKTEQPQSKDRGDFWSEEETIVLLTSIKALGLVDEASKNTEEAARRLKDALKDTGYARSKYQIQRRLDNLQSNYLNAQTAKSLEEAMRKFPFYALYESIFNSGDFCIPDFCTSDAIDELNAREQQEEYDEEEAMLFTEKTKHSRSRSWSDDETSLMLNLLKDLNLVRLIAHRLSFEITCKLVEPMRERGFTRSAMQIQIKLRNLRKSYYRCVRAGSTEKAIADCPFYERLNAIFRQPRDRKLRTVRKLEPIDSSFVGASESFTDHSYSNAAGRTEKIRTVPKVERNESDEDSGSEVWLPVETICDESADDPTSVHEEEEPSRFEEVDETETRASNDDDDDQEAVNEPGDPLEESGEVGDDTGQNVTAENNKRKNILDIGNPAIGTNCESESPGSSHKSSVRLGSDSPLRRPRRNTTKPRSSKRSKDSATLKSVRLVMAEVLRHEKLLQRQHHAWMERQFEIQRKHDREQRELLIRELKEFREVVARNSSMDQIPESPK